MARRFIDAPSLVQEFRARELSRRKLLEGAVASSALLIGAGIGCAGSGDRGTDGVRPDAGVAEDSGASADSGTPMDAGLQDTGEVLDAGPPGPAGHLVGMGFSETDYIGALDAAFAASMDLSFVSPGDSVYFKVNCNNGDLYPHSTRPELIREVAARCLDLGATRIIVGDRSFWGDGNTARNMENNGVAGATRDVGGELLVFDDSTVEWVQIDQGDAPNWAGGFRLPAPVMEADHIINMPCLKTHFISTFTLSLKNFFGLVNPVDRRRSGNLDVHRKPRLWAQIAQVNKFVTPSLNILDGYEALITGGPTVRDGAGPTYAEPKVFIVSADRIATDVTGIAVLQTLSPSSEAVTRSAAWANPQIAQAAVDGVGISGPELYDLSGPTVPMIEAYRANAIAT